MLPVAYDRVRETTTTTGTGSVTLLGAVSGYRTFDSVLSSGQTVYYVIDNGAGDWEAGVGTYSGSNVLARTTVTASSTGSAVSFSAGTKSVWIDATKRTLTDLMPTGAILAYGGTSAPTGWLACDGSAVSRTTYADLFTAIGTTWGSGNGTTTFNVPSLARRVLMGSGGSGTGTIGNSVGNTGGEEDHTLTIGEMPSHNHGITFSATSGLASGTAFNLSSAAGVNTTNTGGGGSHNTIQPSAICLYIIRA